MNYSKKVLQYWFAILQYCNTERLQYTVCLTEFETIISLKFGETYCRLSMCYWIPFKILKPNNLKSHVWKFRLEYKVSLKLSSIGTELPPKTKLE